MYDESLVYALLREIEESIKLVLGQTKELDSPSRLTDSPEGVFMMGGICMQLIFIGEKVKARTKGNAGYSYKKRTSPYHALPVVE